MEAMIFDTLSWIGLALCIGAFFIKDMVKLRLVTLAGCTLMAVYYIHIAVPQGMVSNIVIIMINAIYLLRTLKTPLAQPQVPQQA
jgi:hypothetical protein